MYNIQKVKSWIKRSAKNDLIYHPEAELISDNSTVIYAQPNMKPTILEVFGHLDGGRIKAGVYTNEILNANILQNYMKLRDESERILLIDSKLRFIVDEEIELRILYEYQTGKKVLVQEVYAAMVKDFDRCQLYACKDSDSDVVHVVEGEKVVGLIMRFFPVDTSTRDLLDSFEFKAVGKENHTCDK